MHEIRFSFGNSSHGAVGACVSVYAETPEDGLAELRELLTQYRFEDGVRLETPKGLEDLVVYFNPEAIGVQDVEYEELPEEEAG